MILSPDDPRYSDSDYSEFAYERDDSHDDDSPAEEEEA